MARLVIEHVPTPRTHDAPEGQDGDNTGAHVVVQGFGYLQNAPIRATVCLASSRFGSVRRRRSARVEDGSLSFPVLSQCLARYSQKAENMGLSSRKLRSPKLVFDLDLLKAMADETRQEILQFLCTPGAGEMVAYSVTDIANNFQLTASTVSHHLQLLRRAGLVKVRKRGKERLYWLDLPALRKSVGQFNDLLRLVEQATARAGEQRAAE